MFSFYLTQESSQAWGMASWQFTPLCWSSLLLVLHTHRLTQKLCQPCHQMICFLHACIVILPLLKENNSSFLQESAPSLPQRNDMTNHVGVISLRRWSSPTLRSLSRLADGLMENIRFFLRTSTNWMEISMHRSISGVMKKDLNIC